MAAPMRDPVCGMPTDASTALACEVNGTRYAFCSEYCLNAFRWNPDAYAAAARRRQRSGAQVSGRSSCSPLPPSAWET